MGEVVEIIARTEERKGGTQGEMEGCRELLSHGLSAAFGKFFPPFVPPIKKKINK